MNTGRASQSWWISIAACAVLASCGDDHPGASNADSERDASLGGATGSKTDAAAQVGSDASAPGHVTTSVVDGAAPDAATEHSDGSAPAGTQRAGWTLVFDDEFDGPSGMSPDPARWAFETGGDGFGNAELEFYTTRPQNASLDGQGKLVITARAETYQENGYTSARLKTAGKFEHTYGRYEARLRIPKGQGMWPAFWMLGADIATNAWPSCGEIDIMENIGKEPTLVHGTLHGPGYSGGNGIGMPDMLANKAAFADDFHTFAVEWEENVVRWYVDDMLYQTRTPSDLPKGAKWVYDHPFFILLNLAVGGQWPGKPDGSTTFPQTLTVDYVRVYDRVK
ncbi:MAG: glycoside hydrolase family 16 [Myxococcaceae bacterium]|nr:glycoside hydrolase family 16 [Myxococcaceae bacterium]